MYVGRYVCVYVCMCMCVYAYEYIIYIYTKYRSYISKTITNNEIHHSAAVRKANCPSCAHNQIISPTKQFGDDNSPQSPVAQLSAQWRIKSE